MIWIIVGYMWLFLHRPFEVWPWMGDLRIERLYMIGALVAWLTISQKELVENKHNFAIAMIAFAMIVSTVMSPYIPSPLDSISLQNWLKYLVFYLLVMTSVHKEKDLKILITAFLICFFLYMFHSYREYLNGRYSWAMGTKRMIGVDSTMNDPNAFGASVVYFIPMLLPFVTLIKKKWMYLFVLGYFLLSVRCVQLTGSRTAFVVLGLLVAGLALGSKHRMKAIPVLVLGALLVWATMGENLQNRYMTLFDSSLNESASESAAGRTQGFQDGILLWQRSPIWGVGPDCHGIAIGSGFLSHILYGQIPGELGTLGILGFLALISCFVLNHLQMSEHYKFLARRGLGAEGLYCYRVSLAVVIGLILLLIFGVGGHNGYRYSWIWFAAFQSVALAQMTRKVDAIRKWELTAGRAR